MHMALWSRNIRIFFTTASDSSAVLRITLRCKACSKTCLSTAFQCPNSRPSFTDHMWRRNALRSNYRTHKHRIIMLFMSCTSSRYLSIRKNKSSRLTDCENKFAHAILCPNQWLITAIFSTGVERQTFDSLSHRSLSYDMQIAPPKTRSPRRAVYCFLLLFIFHKVISSCLRLLPRLRVSSILPSIFPSITCFWRQFLLKIPPIQLALIIFILCRALKFPFTLCNTLSFLPRSIQLTSILLHHHISKLSSYFLSTFRSHQAFRAIQT